MARLGYQRYGVQGGDVGAFIAPLVGRLDRDHVIGVHLNALTTFPLMGYMQLQGTRPQTVAYGLTDSSVGQLAWIVETRTGPTRRPSCPRTP